MMKKLPERPQLEMFKTVLTSFINPEHELCLLANKIDWQGLEKEFEPLYGTTGRPSVPIRTIVGLLLLKQIYNLGDETVMQRWLENPYWQHFCGEVYFQYKLPFDPSDFVHFRKRIGEEGMKKIFKQSIDLFGADAIKQEVKEVRIDTTVQEKNITFPTDRKLCEKAIAYFLRIAGKEGLSLKRTYGREIKRLRYQLRFVKRPRNVRKQSKALKRLQRIAMKIHHDLDAQLKGGQIERHERVMKIILKVLTQQRADHQKVYSIHEPEVLCIAKGKEHKPYEFGSKSSFAYSRNGGIILGAMTIEGNLYDGHTLQPQLEQVKELTGKIPKKAIVDRGYRGNDQIGKTEVVMPKRLKRESYYKRRMREARCRSRAGVEGLISHVKYDHRMLRNYLKGVNGDKINTLLAASAYNMKKWMAMIRQEILLALFGRLFWRSIFTRANIAAWE
jgi:IS5 family transposase